MGYQALLFCPDEKLAGVVSQVFGELDFTVETVHEPFAAVKKLMAHRYDALVVDSENEQNASLLFKSARNSSSNQGSLAIALVEGQMGVAKAYRIGANLVLTKPINVEQAKGTLRVARGLLRKSSDAAASAGIAVPPATPAKTTATSAGSTFQPANRGAATTAPPPNRPEAPVSEAPPPGLIPDPASAEFPGEFPELTASAKVEDQSAVAPAAQPQTPVAPALAIERRRSLSSGVIQNAVKNEAAANGSASVPAQNTSSAFTSVPGSAAAPAPAKELPPPPAKKNRIVESEPGTPSQDTHGAAPIPAPTSGSGSATDAPSFAVLGEKDSDGSGGNKKILIAAAAVLALAALGYFGYSYVVKPSPTSQPVSAPQQDSTQPKPALRPTPTPVEAPSQTAPDRTRLAIQPIAPKTATSVSLSNPNSSTGSYNSPEIRIAANVAPSHAANSEPETKKQDAAPIFVKSNRPRAKTHDQAEESAPLLPIPPGAAGTNDSDLSGLLSASPSLAKPALATLKVSQGVSQGLLIKKVQPRYPQAALAVHAQGAVLIDATVTKDGNVTNLKVLKGDPILAAAALEAVRQWRYKPYYLDGAPVEIQTQITVNFNPN